MAPNSLCLVLGTFNYIEYDATANQIRIFKGTWYPIHEQNHLTMEKYKLSKKAKHIWNICLLKDRKWRKVEITINLNEQFWAWNSTYFLKKLQTFEKTFTFSDSLTGNTWSTWQSAWFVHRLLREMMFILFVPKRFWKFSQSFLFNFHNFVTSATDLCSTKSHYAERGLCKM